jgi:hypothetical protein
MSANNGNRSRFHVDRKRRIARRMQMRAVAQALTEKRETAAAEKPSTKQVKTGSTPGDE